MFQCLPFFLATLCLTAQNSAINLLEPDIDGRQVTIRYTTQNYVPDDGDRLLFQLAEDQQFTTGIVYHEQSSGNREYRNLPDGNYYVRALIKGPDDESKSDWSNVIWFRIFTPTGVKPSLLLVGSEPVTGDALSLVWTPLEENHILAWQLQLSSDPDFPATCGETLSFLPAANQYEAEIPLEGFEGEGLLFARIRARFPLDNSEWSNLLVIAYNRRVMHYYSLAHIPKGEGWDTWLQLNMPRETFAQGLPPDVTVSFLRPSVLGDPELSRLVIDDLDPGGVLRVPISAEIDGAPVLLASYVPISVAVHYRQRVAGDIGVLQLREFSKGRRASLAALVERFDGAGKSRSFSGLVLANQADLGTLVNLRFQVLDTTTNRIIEERQEAVFVDRWENQVFLLSEFLPEIARLIDQNKPLNWSINVFAHSDFEGLDLLGATFNLIEGNLFPSYFQGQPF